MGNRPMNFHHNPLVPFSIIVTTNQETKKHMNKKFMNKYITSVID